MEHANVNTLFWLIKTEENERKLNKIVSILRGVADKILARTLIQQCVRYKIEKLLMFT